MQIIIHGQNYEEHFKDFNCNLNAFDCRHWCCGRSGNV